MDEMSEQKAPHVPAAFINALTEEGSRETILQFLQETWNDYCQVANERDALQKYIAETPQWTPTHRHAEGGEYRMVGAVKFHAAENTWQNAILYDNSDGLSFVRLREDFLARFVALPMEE